MHIAGSAPPLAGFRVLDCTNELGLYATKLLADLGADVIRLEPPGGEALRRYPPLAGEDGRVSLYHAHFNVGKRSVTLDVEPEEGAALLLDLVRSCHAIVEASDEEALLSSRIGVERLEAARPGLVLVSITPFARGGPRRDERGGDLIVAAESGLLWLNGRPGGPPHRPGGEQAAHMAGLVAANAALLGIFHQQRTGRGCRLDVPADFAATLATLQTANANVATWHGRIPTRRGMGIPAARHIYRAADGWVGLTALPGQWEKLVRLLAQHDAAADLGADAYLDGDYRAQHAAHINDVIEAFTSRFPKQQVFQMGQAAGVATVAVNEPAEISADSFLGGRGWFRDLPHPELERDLRYPGPAARFAGRPTGPRLSAPSPGADNRDVWVGELGMSEETFERLRGMGVL